MPYEDDGEVRQAARRLMASCMQRAIDTFHRNTNLTREEAKSLVQRTSPVEKQQITDYCALIDLGCVNGLLAAAADADACLRISPCQTIA